MSLSEETKRSLLATAEEAAQGAGKLLRDLVTRPRQLSHKGFRDLVTDADIAAQQLITDLLQERFPDHGFLGEEDDPGLPSTGDILWVIDPVDGTSNFSRQQPNFSVSIAAAVLGEQWSNEDRLSRATVQVGVVYDPMADELFSAVAGHGCSVNGRQARVSTVSELAPAIVALDWGHSHENRRTVLAALSRFAHEVHSIRAIGSAALALAWVAAGRLDGYVQFALGPWDAAAGSLLIHEAGGVVTTVSGRPWTLADRGCLASNGPVHEQFRQLVTIPRDQS
jgi:myo-inositol-1(or 4)-monophosphatase